MPYVASEHVSSLAYDFTGYTLDGQPLSGVTPEPDDGQLEQFRFRMLELMKRVGVEEVGGEPTEKPKIRVSEVLEALRAGGGDDSLANDVYQMFAGLTSNQPSAADLQNIKPRARKDWIIWIIRELFNPEAQAAGGRN